MFCPRLFFLLLESNTLTIQHKLWHAKKNAQLDPGHPSALGENSKWVLSPTHNIIIKSHTIVAKSLAWAQSPSPPPFFGGKGVVLGGAGNPSQSELK